MIRVIGTERLSLVEVGAFLAASESIGFVGESRVEVYRWSEGMLRHHEYWTLNRHAKGLVRAYMERMTGLSRAQCTRRVRAVGDDLERPSVQPAAKPRLPPEGAAL